MCSGILGAITLTIKHEIDNHPGGFAIADKALSEKEMLTRVNLALQGATHTKDIKTALEFKPEWLEVLRNPSFPFLDVLHGWGFSRSIIPLKPYPVRD